MAEVYTSAARIKEICQTDRNIHVCMTLGDGSTSRKFMGCEYLWFDIDNLDIKQAPKVLEIVAKMTQIPANQFYMNWSGHGVHLITRIEKVRSISEFQLLQHRYKIVCELIREEFKLDNISAVVDMVFSSGHTLRVPGTINQKDGSDSYVMQKCSEQVTQNPLHFVETVQSTNKAKVESDLSPSREEPSSTLVSPQRNENLPKVIETEPEEQVQFYGIPDSKEILSKCNFLQKCINRPQDVREPEWYAMLSITSRLENGRELSHKMSQGHPGYNHRETETKINQAERTSSPRTCKGINAHYGECEKCPMFGKVKSPISIKSEQHIATRDMGFHTVTPKGRHVPAYDDMVKFIAQKTHLKMLRDSEDFLVFGGKVYTDVSENDLKAVARDNFKPSVASKDTHEVYRRLSENSSIKTNKAINDYPFLLNMDNGVLNLKTKELMDHSPDFLFTTKIDFDYNPEAKAPRFLEWLNYVMENDQDKVNAILDYMTYAISGTKISNEKFLLCTGEGANGKSVLGKIMLKLLGEYCNYAKENTFINYGKEVLIGTRLLIFEELPDATAKEFWEEIKDLSSGGVAVINRKFKRELRQPCWTKFMFICNSLPYGTTSSEGFFRRFIIIRFNKNFSDAEKINGIEETFVDELPGILNMLLERLPKLIGSGFNIELKGSVHKELEQYKIDKDIIGQYCKEELVKQDKAYPPKYAKKMENGDLRIDVSKLYEEHFTNWYERQGLPKKVPKGVFTRRIKPYLKDKVVTDEKSHRTFLYGMVPRPSDNDGDAY